MPASLNIEADEIPVFNRLVEDATSTGMGGVLSGRPMRKWPGARDVGTGGVQCYYS